MRDVRRLGELRAWCAGQLAQSLLHDRDVVMDKTTGELYRVGDLMEGRDEPVRPADTCRVCGAKPGSSWCCGGGS